MYYLAEGVPQDYPEALNLFREAAEQGDGVAQWNLGIMYYLGKVVDQDYTQAYIWSALSVLHLIDRARETRDLAEQKMTPQQVTDAQEIITEWITRKQEALLDRYLDT